jgi:SAM-dependent methyltransferase
MARRDLQVALRAMRERLWPSRGVYLKSAGVCSTCNESVEFIATGSWFRDEFVCGNCGSIPRERALMWVIQEFFPAWRDFAIHESSPGGRGASVMLHRECAGYVGTHFFAELAPGDIHATGWRNENLEEQTFADCSFDLVVTQDVMEHLFDPAAALREIARTLRPGGAHVFTVPLVRKAEPSRIRAERRADGDIGHLLPAEYHGNPVSPEGSLVTRDWGYDICDFVAAESDLSTTMVFIDNLSLGIRAEYIEVLVSRKPLRA